MSKPWQPASNGADERPWFVFRYSDRFEAPAEVAADSRGQHRRFGDLAAAKSVANTLNLEDAE